MAMGSMLNNAFFLGQSICHLRQHFHHSAIGCRMGVPRPGAASESARARAIGMIEAGCNQREVAECLAVTRRTVNKWWRRFLKGESLQDRPRAGRPSKVSRIAKIVCAKAVSKRGQSVRKLSTRLPNKGHHVSKSTVQRYMRQSLGLKAYRRPQGPKISEKQQKKSTRFCKSIEKWTVTDFQQVMWSDEAHLE